MVGNSATCDVPALAPFLDPGLDTLAGFGGAMKVRQPREAMPLTVWIAFALMAMGIVAYLPDGLSNNRRHSSRTSQHGKGKSFSRKCCENGSVWNPPRISGAICPILCSGQFVVFRPLTKTPPGNSACARLLVASTDIEPGRS